MIGINQITAAYTNCIFAIGVKLRGIRTKKIHAVFENNFDIYRLIIVADNAPQQDPDLIALVADARRWASELLEGRASSIQHITEREGLRSGSVSRILPLAWLAPDISTAILEGRQPPHLTAKTLRALPELPLDWAEQQRILGFA